MALIDGKISIVGGKDRIKRTIVATAEVFDMATQTWSLSSEIFLKTGRRYFSLLTLPTTTEELCSSTG